MKQVSSPEVTAEILETYRTEMVAAPQRFALTRRAVAAQLRLWGYGQQLVEAAALCLTEMLSNVHRHAGSPDCELALHARPDGVRIAVSDRSADLPVVTGEPDWFAERGRGMFLLTRAAHSWGADVTPTGKEVWVLLRGEPRGPATAAQAPPTAQAPPAPPAATAER